MALSKKVIVLKTVVLGQKKCAFMFSSAIGVASGGLIGGLIGLVITEQQVRIYDPRSSRISYLVMVEGTDNDIRRAESIFSD